MKKKEWKYMKIKLKLLKKMVGPLTFLLLTPQILFGTHKLEKIRPDYHEIQKFTLHSFGHFTYGKHSNTLHVRRAFIRVNYNPSETLQFLFTLKGNIDTHTPEINYKYLLGNIDLYDYGFHYTFLKNFFFTVRGAGSYQITSHSYMLLPNVFSDSNLAEFDGNLEYNRELPQGPGVRLGFKNETMTIAYSQADHRHFLPQSLFFKLKLKDFHLRFLGQRFNSNPAIWGDEYKRLRAQLALWNRFKLPKGFDLFGLVEFTWEEVAFSSLRLEQAVKYKGFVFAMRQIFKKRFKALYEFSLLKELEDVMSFGVQIGTDEKFYVGTEINF